MKVTSPLKSLIPLLPSQFSSECPAICFQCDLIRIFLMNMHVCNAAAVSSCYFWSDLISCRFFPSKEKMIFYCQHFPFLKKLRYIYATIFFSLFALMYHSSVTPQGWCLFPCAFLTGSEIFSFPLKHVF